MLLNELPPEIIYEISLFLTECEDAASFRKSHSSFTFIPQCRASSSKKNESQKKLLNQLFKISVVSNKPYHPPFPPSNASMSRESLFHPFDRKYISCVVVHHNVDLLKGVLNRLRNIHHTFGVVVNCPQSMRKIFDGRCPPGCFLDLDQLLDYNARIRTAITNIDNKWNNNTGRSFMIVMNPSEIKEVYLGHLALLLKNNRHFNIDVIVYRSVYQTLPDWFSYVVDTHIFKKNDEIPDDKIEPIIEKIVGKNSLKSTMALYQHTENQNHAYMFSNLCEQYVSLDVTSVLPLADHTFWHLLQ